VRTKVFDYDPIPLRLHLLLLESYALPTRLLLPLQPLPPLTMTTTTTTGMTRSKFVQSLPPREGSFTSVSTCDACSRRGEWAHCAARSSAAETWAQRERDEQV
jgi:hypothetical protein